ncbi:uncharacterized protein PHACADRAFT_125904 [Phanerochaete carnosa HHB-10118-sp]|uniref:DUF6534 domain-containing protein n=1 Tax=Phanerochaete carnosa (strain HHB-10118-sp) TaxID=650164 RepID=K5WPG5_PHACS|nr:uncharacterized protein PHACADRAFT_125904 [Phanerochaete carnosa HHB-10118-sp]EKM52237.1 hypothetical protein PHACADRAFT_125904 [Phanerochaete carnosa HHB-10118-sp]
MVIVTVPADVATIAAPVLLGALFNWGLYGALAVQVYIYHLSFPNDGWVAQSLVYGVFAVDTVQTILVTNDVFNAYTRHFGQIEILVDIQTEWLAVPIFSGIVSCAVQMHYARRIGILSRSRVLQLLISALALTQGVAAIVTGVQAKIAGSFIDLQEEAVVSTGIWLAGSALCDIIIASLMAYLLLRHNIKGTDTRAIINRLVRLIIETGTLTGALSLLSNRSVAATIDIIVYFALRNDDYHSCIATILAKLYSNALLVLFNSRIRIVGGRAGVFASTSAAGRNDRTRSTGRFTTNEDMGFYVPSSEGTTADTDSDVLFSRDHVHDVGRPRVVVLEERQVSRLVTGLPSDFSTDLTLRSTRYPHKRRPSTTIFILWKNVDNSD